MKRLTKSGLNAFFKKVDSYYGHCQTLQNKRFVCSFLFASFVPNQYCHSILQHSCDFINATKCKVSEWIWLKRIENLNPISNASTTIFTLIGWCFFSCLLGGIPSLSFASDSGKVPLETATVMAPLDIRNASESQTFENLLGQAKAIGIDSVSVDVWWGKVEKNNDQQFDWSFYDDVFGKIRGQGLKIVPIMSFHRCGPDSECDYPLPDWLWSRFTNVGLSDKDLKYESETGKVLDDALSPWATATPVVLDQYREFMQAFALHFSAMAGDFIEINISLGPTGELRYLAYNSNDGWSYPQRGNLQAYSELARTQFRNWALNQYGGLSGVSNHWKIPLNNPGEIHPPGGHLPPNSGRRAETFFQDNDHNDTAYGRDFIDWYNTSLVDHGRRVLMAANEALDGAMTIVPLGMKIPGVHWQMLGCAEHPRIAEVTAGLVQTSLNLTATPEARADAYGYRNILDMISQVKKQIGREMTLHFTAMEMDNDSACGNDNSMADALVFWISEGTQDRGIRHAGENALACVNLPNDDRSWEMIRNVYAHVPYRGLNLLRLINTGCNPWVTDKDAYQSFIEDYRGSQATNTLTVHLAEWQFCPENQGCRYNLHAWDGLSGKFPLAYEGFFKGKHWWVGKIPRAPDRFKFTFNNSNSWESNSGQFDREYNRSSSGSEIYIVGRGDVLVRIIRPYIRIGI